MTKLKKDPYLHDMTHIQLCIYGNETKSFCYRQAGRQSGKQVTTSPPGPAIS